jgi:hypothetical protein
VAAAEFEEAGADVGLLLQPAADAEVTATAAVTRTIVFSETLIAPNRIPVRVIACPNRAVTPSFGGNKEAGTARPGNSQRVS